MTKKVTIGTKPTNKTIDADQWVTASFTNQPTETIKTEPLQVEPTTRFTIDIPVSLHRLIKSDCALRGIKMNEEIRKLLENHFLKHN